MLIFILVSHSFSCDFHVLLLFFFCDFHDYPIDFFLSSLSLLSIVSFLCDFHNNSYYYSFHRAPQSIDPSSS